MEQTKEDRVTKYNSLRAVGYSVERARRIRDWSHQYYNIQLHLDPNQRTLRQTEVI